MKFYGDYAALFKTLCLDRTEGRRCGLNDSQKENGENGENKKDAPTIINTVIILILAVLTAASGFYTARLWYVASKKSVRPLYVDLRTIAPVGDQAPEAIDRIVGINNYVSENGKANQAAAKWTAIRLG